jgi:heme/copper-type cytochrome/quinol oxidase subunit 3
MRRAQLGMAMFLIAEAVFFFLLILAFVYFRALPRRITPLNWLFTTLLFLSSLTMWRAVAGPSIWRCLTIALGIAFLIGQFAGPILFGARYSVLTAIHGIHIFAGLTALAIVPASGVRTIALYWYFFALVWLVIFFVYVRSAA